MLATKPRGDWRDLPRGVYQDTTDPIFFHKSNVHTGSKFVFWGRTAPQTVWVVTAIWTITGSGHNRIKSSVANVRTLDDMLELHCVETGEWRTMRFLYMSYSAIWRLEE